MLSKTLSLYFGWHFIKMVGAIFISAFLLIALITYLEFFNHALHGELIGGVDLAIASLFRVPIISEQSLPFAVLYGSIAAFVLANRRLEVVIARAAGVSAWQFLLPACVVGMLVGVFATTVYNPMATWTQAVGRPALGQGRAQHADRPRPPGRARSGCASPTPARKPSSARPNHLTAGWA